MANEDKLINIVIKYSQEGAAAVATSQEDVDKKLEQGYKALEDYYKGNTQAMQDFVKQNKDLIQDVTTLEEKFRGLRMSARELSQIGTFLTIGGGLLTAGLVADANNYVKTVGAINQQNQEWLGYENEIKNANLSIGQTTAQAILPSMKTAAELMDKIAGVIKENPWLIQGALTAGGIMLALGVAIKVIAELVKVVADVGLLLTKTGVLKGGEGGGGLAGGAGGALGFVTLTATSVIIGAELGMALGNFLGKLIYGETYQKQNLGDAYMTFVKILQLPWVTLAQIIGRLDPALTGAVNKFITFENEVDHWFGSKIGASKDVAPDQAAAEAKAQQEIITQQEVQAFIDRNKQLAAAQDNWSKQRADIIGQYEQQIIDITQAYESQRASLLLNSADQISRENRDFAESQARAQRNYNEQVAKSNRDFEIQQKQAARQHQIDMQRLEDEHNARVADLAAARDALGLVKENQAYELQKTQKSQDFTDQQTQAKQAHALQLQDMRQAFDQQRAEAQAAHDQQIADQRAALAKQLATLDANHAAEMAKLKSQEDDKLKKLDDAYQKQIDMIQTAFIDRLRALDSNILGDTAAFNNYMANQASNFQSWLAALQNHALGYSAGSVGVGSGSNLFNTGSTSQSGVSNLAYGTPGPRQAGGYMNMSGPGEDGQYEYMMSHSATRAMESMLGGSLTQANVLAAVMAGRNAQQGSAGKVMQINVTGRSLSISEIRTMVDHSLDARLSDLLPAFGGG